MESIVESISVNVPSILISRMASYFSFVILADMVDSSNDDEAPTWAPMNKQFGFSYTILNDSHALVSDTLAIGAFLLISFALNHGRRPIYIVSTAVQLECQFDPRGSRRSLILCSSMPLVAG